MADADDPQPKLTTISPVALAMMAGAAAGVFIAFADFGAMWLWLPLWRDRAGLLFRLLTLMVPASALLLALLTAFFSYVWPKIAARTPDRLQPLVAPATIAVLASYPLHLLAVRLMSGGSMARLAQHDLIVACLSVLLPSGAGLMSSLALRTARWAHDNDRRQTCVAVGSLALAFVLSKINQTYLPNLYEYLHQTLAVTAWLLAAYGMLAGLQTAHAARMRGWMTGPARTLTVGALLAGALIASVCTLDMNLNVRVAMFDARSASSRALLFASNPLLRWIEDGQGDGHGRPGLARGELDTTGLPTQPGAHVLLVTIDALRADHLGSYGYARPVSPKLDALAKQATQFDRAYAQAPHSSYSLSSLMTSDYIHEVVELARPLPTATLATTLRDHGYHTAAFFTDGIFHTEGKKLSVYRDSAFGFALFDHTNRESEQQTTRVLQEADRIREDGEPPSFLWVHYFDVHEPYQETTFGTGEMDRYDSEILHVDRELDRLLTGLKQRLSRDVVLAITADHGEEFRDHGGVYHGSTLYDEQVRVPLIVQASVMPTMRVAAPVEVIDVAPTLLGLVGIEAAPSMRGRDLRAVALGRMSDPGPVFSAVLTKRMAVEWPFKLIADLRFGLFELYDLSRDPDERKNLANVEATRLAHMKDLVYAWLDSLEHERGSQVTAGANDWAKELRWGRLGDRRAVEPMSRLLLDQKSPTALRIEAGQILANLADTSSASMLVAGLATKPPAVAAEAAIALGRMYDARAQSALKQLVHVEDPYVRARAAVSLARLRDRDAVPALIDALWVAPTQYEREEAVRWLGRLGDRRAVEPLLQILPEFGLRYLTAVALGRIGDERAYPALSEMLSWEHHTNIRDEVVRGIGLLGDKRAMPLLIEAYRKEPELKNTGESLVRLGAIEQGYLGGVDASSRAKGAAGFASCEEGPLLHDWDYLQRTWCVSRGTELSFRLPLPSQHTTWSDGAELVIRSRRTDSAEACDVRATSGGRGLATLRMDASWRDHRVALEARGLRKSMQLELEATCSAEARMAIDHVLIVPHSDAVAPLH